MVVLRAILNKSIMKFYENIKNIDLFFYCERFGTYNLLMSIFFKSALLKFTVDCPINLDKVRSGSLPPFFFFYIHLLNLIFLTATDFI